MFLLCSYRGMAQAPHTPATPSDGTTIAPDRAAADRDWAVLELEALHELARIGTAIAERVNQQHAAAVAVTPPGAARAALHRDVAQAFMRIARAVRLTLAMFGRALEAHEALAAGAVLPTASAMPELPQPSAGAGQRAAAETARAPAPDLDELDRDREAEGDKRDDEKPDNGPDPARRADGSNRPDRESLTAFADFGFSLDHCRPGDVIARIYRDLGLPPDPARWPQAWPDGAPVPAKVAGRPATPPHSEADRSQGAVLPRPVARGEAGSPGGMQSSPRGLPAEGAALADGKSPHPRGASSPEPLRVSDPGSSLGQALSHDPRIKSERESQQDAGLLPSDSSMPPEDTS
jgi:hypothetical protein